MARLLKILMLLVAAFVAVGVLASVALFLFFDPNDFREEISAGAKKATGRELLIEGDISLSLFPWIAVEIGRTELGNAEGFGDEPFFRFDKAHLSVRLMPLLLRQEVTIGTASLETLVVNLQVNKAGVNNWDDLADSAEDESAASDVDDTNTAATEATTADAPAIDIENISVTDATLSYADAKAGSKLLVTGLHFTTSEIALGSPFDLDAGFKFLSTPDNFGGALGISGTFLVADGMTQIDISGLNVNGALTGIAPDSTEFRFDAPEIAINTEDETVNLGEMSMGILGLYMVADVERFSYAGNPGPKAKLTVQEFSLTELMETLGETPPATVDPDALQRVSFSGNAAVGLSSLKMSDMKLSLDDTNMKGSLSVPLEADGELQFELAVDSLVLDGYMAPAMDADPDSATEAETSIEIPAEMIRGLHAAGRFTMEQAVLSGIVLENLELGLNSANGKLRLHPIAAEMFDGTYNGDIRIDASGETPAISVNENIANVQLAAFAKAMYDIDNVSGTIDGKFVLSGHGADSDAITRDLDGNISFVLADGEWQGKDVWYELRKARAKLKQETPPEPQLPARTQFNSVKASGTVTDGVMSNDDFLAELPFLRLTGKGKIDFVKASIDYKMDARVIESPEFAGEVSAAELKDFTAVVVPLRVSGPLASPSIVPDIDALIRREVEKEIDKRKNELLDRLLGGGEHKAENDENADGAEEEEEPDAEEQIKKALKDLFKD